MASMSPLNTAAAMADASPHGDGVSPRQATPKNVAFELLFVDAPQYRARLPMRVQIFPHDTTDSIVTTVKNFYGLYSGPTGSKGVSFEDKEGNTLIARYENFANNMVVYVRVFEEYPADQAACGPPSYQGSAQAGPQHYYPSDAFHGQSAQASPHDLARPASRTSRQRSRSPHSPRSRRDDSVGSAGHKRRSRSVKNPSALSQADAFSDQLGGYSSDEGAPSTSSARTKEQLGNTDISVENIVEGGRRKRAKFESSELPLFAPPQMPAATSNPSVSPARRIEHQRPSMSFAHGGQNPFVNPRPMQAAQSYTNNLQNNMYTAHAGHHRSRGSVSMGSNGGILPTPDPTVGSCVSEEDKDVALQLMRLGDMSNISHGRTSASTLDDTFSGRADVASSTGATSDSEGDSGEEGAPPARRQKLDALGSSGSVYQTTEARFAPPAGAELGAAGFDNNDAHAYGASLLGDAKSHSRSASKSKVSLPNSSKSKSSKNKMPRPPAQVNTKKLPPVPGGPMSPTSAPSSRKPSIASPGGALLPPGEDDQPDLSTKPRCQRCRKSKKGCDRQRPCGRCRDAGLSAEQCISEDEGNGRKGRYGRHMGVPIKKEEMPAPGQPTLLPAAPIAVPPMVSADKAKKRKR